MRTVSENRVFDYQGVGNAAINPAVCVRNITDYSPFGVSLDGRAIAYQPAPAPTPSVGVIYLHKFDDGATTHPYTTAPDAVDPNLSNGVWTNNTNYWYNYTGYTGKAIAINRADYDTARLYLNFTVASGKNMDVKSFSFYHRSSSTGYSNYKLYVNNILVGSGTIYVTSNSNFQFTGTQNVLNAISGLTGNVTVRLDLFGGLHGIAATFRLDNFTLNGYTQLIGTPNLLAKVYRYGFDGMELDDEMKGKGNSYDFGARMLDPRLGRWFSPDAWHAKYPSLSTYNFSMNNPIRCSDPDGNEVEDVIIKGAAKRKAFNELQKSVRSELKLKRNSNGEVEYKMKQGVEFDNLSNDSKQLIKAIDNEEIKVNIISVKNNIYKELFIPAGSFYGNEYNENTNTVEATQVVDPKSLRKMSNASGKKGADMLHEVTEAYQGGLIALNSKTSYPDPGNKNILYDIAHGLATPQTQIVQACYFDEEGKQIYAKDKDFGDQNVMKAKYYVFNKHEKKKYIAIKNGTREQYKAAKNYTNSKKSTDD